MDECKSCDNGTSCTSCIASNTVIVNGRCICQNGYWAALSLDKEEACKKCYDECRTCKSSLFCESCIADYSDKDPAGGCKCNDPYYSLGMLSSSGSCLSCDPECSKCSKEYLCDECKSINSKPNYTKGCDCIDGFYKDSSLTDYCQKCTSQCLTCKSSTKCIKCISMNARPLDIGCECLDGFFSSGPLIYTDSCSACHSDCFQCNQTKLCITCNDPNGIPNLSEGCFCKYDEYLGNDSYCKKCNMQCYNCSDATTCNSCKDPLTEVATSNYCKCIDGYYNISLNPTSCKECPDFCVTCPNKTMCDVCKLKFSNPYQNGSCICPVNSTETDSECVCPEGQAIAVNSAGLFECNNCHSTCKTCTDTTKFGCKFCFRTLQMNDTDNTCSICSDGYFFNGTLCEKCHDKCKRCINSSLCIKCKDHDFSPDLDSGICKKVCPQGKANQDDICVPCPNLCEVCKTPIQCETCSENTEKIKDSCFCTKGYKEIQSKCKQVSFDASLTVSELNNLKLEFTEKTDYELNTKDFIIEIPGIDFDFSLVVKDRATYKFLIDYKESIDDDTKAQIKVLNQSLRSESGSFFFVFSYSGTLVKQVKIPQQVRTMNQIIKGGKAAVVATAIAIAIVSNPAAAWAMLNTIQLITYMPINSNPLALAIRQFCGSLGGFSFIPSPMPYIFGSDISEPPYKEAREYGITTSVFWINVGPTATLFIDMLILWPFIWMLSKFQLGKITIKLISILSNYKYNIFLRFIAQAYLDIGFFSLVQIKSVIFN